ncbi:hypothetical protein LCGC14_0368160 [marine sediment metagenome]|uniref:Uncharacterized protein n=1 Tax=marine sediment metagenome TaxID=412755 RepID=A0A0F9TBS9_9ZZZZ
MKSFKQFSMNYEHIKHWTTSFTVAIACFIKRGFFERGSLAGDKFKCKICNNDVDFVKIPSTHTLKGGDMREDD